VLGALSALGAFALASSPGCGTDAHGVENCRQIERARCGAALSCGIVPNEEQCEIYYRDHCLHGLPAGVAPEQTYIDLCVSAIEKLGSCVKSTGPQTPVENCGVDTHDATLACDAVQFPERTYACGFLSKTPAPPLGGAGEGGGGGAGG
jgi:hypothetical protein